MSSIMHIDLCGSWTVSSLETGHQLPATVPGCIHTDLLSANLLTDPFVGLHELDSQWVADQTWAYKRTFTVSSAHKEQRRILLRCDGLDTLAHITINDTYVGVTANMFRVYEFDVAHIVSVGRNEITITFQSATKYAKHRLEQRWLPNWGVPEGDKLPGVNYLRKCQCQFGWDWGPKLATCGIWRPIEISGLSGPRIRGMHVQQRHDRVARAVMLRISVSSELICGSEANITGENLQYNCSIQREGKIVVERTISSHSRYQYSGEISNNGSGLVMEEVVLELTIAEPKLWWPNGLGDQNLYGIFMVLRNEAGHTFDITTKTIGLRTLKLIREPDEWGESFYFEVNGVSFFAKGGNWIPADIFPSRVEECEYRKLLQGCAKANMNMVRVWGGGIYEDDVFYDLCDQLGLCVWQDFMFACAAYPVFDEDWLANVKVEVRQNVVRLRSHACMALWCGNNELEQGLIGDDYTRETMSWSDYSKLFDRILRNVVQSLNPDTDYWPGSPHSPLGNRLDFNNPRWGDAHLWGVWHGHEPFEWYRGCEHRFNSEFGFQSFPDIHTVRRYVPESERNITSRTMELHQRSGIGNQTIVHYMLDWFQLPTSLENVLWASQITQGMAIKYAVEHWRRSMPRGMGTLYWQINDCWPVASWSSIDYYGRWKALHYMARAFNAPVLVSGVEDNVKRTVQPVLSNDLRKELRGRLVWELWTTGSMEYVIKGSEDITASALSNSACTCIDLSSIIPRQVSPFQALLLYWFESEGGDRLTRNLSTFTRPKHLSLLDPGLSWSFERQDSKDGDVDWIVEVAAERCAMWVFIDDKQGKLQGSIGFFHLSPAESPVKVVLQASHSEDAASGLELDELRERIEVHSLHDVMK